MIEILLGVFVLLGSVNLILLFFKKAKVDDANMSMMFKDELQRSKKELLDAHSNLKMELTQLHHTLKSELIQSFLDNRNEQSKSTELLRKSLDDQLKTMNESQVKANEKVIEKQNEIRVETEKKLDYNASTLSKAFEDLKKQLNEQLNLFAENQRKYQEEYIGKHNEIKTATDNKLEQIRKTVEEKLHFLQTENSKKLDEMRMTVDQKLQEALDKKLSESFNTVSKQLQDVYKGLGEMKTLANDVGGLKKVLSNVKTRGIIGEIQLGNILESILSPEQYEYNVAVKANSQERVEYAIKLPGKDDDNKSVYLPIDSKFPDSAYQELLTAYDEVNTEQIIISRKKLENAIKLSAKDIHDKYINPPDTTDFGILFLPFEGLYAEILQNTNLVHQLQNDYHINIAGPTTLGAFINSLQMGFKTLAIEKRSSEVWKLLGVVKSEFLKFGDVLIKAQNKIKGAGDELDNLIGTRTKKIQRALNRVEILPGNQSVEMIDSDDNE
jgi:DNA recombination protein RmuC